MASSYQLTPCVRDGVMVPGEVADVIDWTRRLLAGVPDVVVSTELDEGDPMHPLLWRVVAQLAPRQSGDRDHFVRMVYPEMPGEDVKGGPPWQALGLANEALQGILARASRLTGIPVVFQTTGDGEHMTCGPARVRGGCLTVAVPGGEVTPLPLTVASLARLLAKVPRRGGAWEV